MPYYCVDDFHFYVVMMERMYCCSLGMVGLDGDADQMNVSLGLQKLQRGLTY